MSEHPTFAPILKDWVAAASQSRRPETTAEFRARVEAASARRRALEAEEQAAWDARQAAIRAAAPDGMTAMDRAHAEFAEHAGRMADERFRLGMSHDFTPRSGPRG